MAHNIIDATFTPFDETEGTCEPNFCSRFVSSSRMTTTAVSTDYPELVAGLAKSSPHALEKLFDDAVMQVQIDFLTALMC